MKTYLTHFLKPIALFCVIVLATSCHKEADDFVILPAQDYARFSDFDKLSISNGFTVTIRQGTARQLSIATTAANTPKLSVTQTNGTLSVQIINKTNNGPTGTIDITMPSLTAINFSGGVEATITGFTQADLSATFSGGSEAMLTGSVGQLTANLTGGSSLHTYSFPANSAVITLSGGSEARVAVTQNLTVLASGGSALFYKGTPTLVQNLTGGSKITKE